MDLGTIIAIVSLAPIGMGAYFSGKTNAVQGLASTNQILQSKIDLQTEIINSLKDQQAADRREVAVLRELVTQRANVEAVQETVDRVEGKVDLIAAKVGVDV